MEQMDGLDVVGCERCDDLCGSRSRIVNGVGPADADLLFVGEAPGANEDEQGEPSSAGAATCSTLGYAMPASTAATCASRTASAVARRTTATPER